MKINLKTKLALHEQRFLAECLICLHAFVLSIAKKKSYQDSLIEKGEYLNV